MQEPEAHGDQMKYLKSKIKMPWNYSVVNKSICIFDGWQYKITLGWRVNPIDTFQYERPNKLLLAASPLPYSHIRILTKERVFEVYTIKVIPREESLR